MEPTAFPPANMLCATGLIPADHPPSLTEFLDTVLTRVRICSDVSQFLTTELGEGDDPEDFVELKDSAGATQFVKPKSTLILCTHSGKFHADEVFALALRLLKAKLDGFAVDGLGYTYIVRTRDEQVIGWADEVYDVGGVYDEATRRFDHHQRGFGVCFKPQTDAVAAAQRRIQMATSGLAYKWIGKEVIQGLYPKFPPAEVSLLHDELYTGFVEQLDAIDNGRPLAAPFHDGTKPKITFCVTTHISAQVGELNGSFGGGEGEGGKGPTQNQRFFYAMVKAISPFLYKLHEKIEKMRVAAPIVSRALENCLARGDRILFLDEACPWKKMYDRLKKDAELDQEDVPMFCVLPGDNGAYMLMTVPLDASQPWLGSEAKLPESWAGLKNEALDKVTGLTGTAFCHAGCWIAGAKTQAVALSMAKQAIEISEREHLQDAFGTDFVHVEAETETGGGGGGGGGPARHKRTQEEAFVQTRAPPHSSGHVKCWADAKARMQHNAGGAHANE